MYRDQALVTRRDARGVPTSSSSQPSLMAAMLEALALEPGQRVLEVGTGTGYHAALLSTLVDGTGQVTSVELDPDLAERARVALAAGEHRVEVVVGDGRLGWASGAPFDRIVVTASGPGLPRPWLDQLRPGGLLELPLWLRGTTQAVVVLRREGDELASVAMIPGGFMGLRGSLDEEGPVVHDQLVASDLTESPPSRPLASLTGPALRHLRPDARRRLLALALGPSRSVRLPVRAPHRALELFVSLAAPEDRMVQCVTDCPARSGVGVVGTDGHSLSVVTQARSSACLATWGGSEAERLAIELVEGWRDAGRPGIGGLRLRVGYGTAPRAWHTSRRGDAVLAFDWLGPPTLPGRGR